MGLVNLISNVLDLRVFDGNNFGPDEHLKLFIMNV